MQISQINLNEKQLDQFDHNIFEKSQVADFISLTKTLLPPKLDGIVLDIGGGSGYFASLLNHKTKYGVRVLDSNPKSINKINEINDPNIKAEISDALKPVIYGDERVVCFNLILHHLVGRNASDTYHLQKSALALWGNSTNFIFVHEYIYESFIGNASQAIIFYITSNKLLSFFCKQVAVFIPSLNANTFGVGVRFRSNSEWVRLFKDAGYSSIQIVQGALEGVSLPRRILLIKEIRRNSYLIMK